MREKGKMLRMKAIAILSLIILMILPIMPVFAQPFAQPKEKKPEISEEEGWKIIKTDIITLKFPSGGKKPIFIWWYTKDNKTEYVVNFMGLWEYIVFNFNESMFFKRKYQLNPQLVNETIIKPHLKNLEKIHVLLKELYENATLLYQMIDKIDDRINTSSSLTESIKDSIKEYEDHLKEVNEHAYRIQEFTSSIIEGIDSYIGMFRDFEKNAKSYGYDPSSYINDIASASISIKLSINSIGEVSVNISKETDIEAIASLILKLENEIKNIQNKYSFIEERSSELINYVNGWGPTFNWTGHGTWSEWKEEMERKSRECYDNFHNVMDRFKDMLREKEALRDKIEELKFFYFL